MNRYIRNLNKMKAGVKFEARACQYKAMNVCYSWTFHSVEKEDVFSLRLGKTYSVFEIT